MKLRNNQSLTPGKRAGINLQLMAGIDAALHDKDSEIELADRDIEYLLLRCMQMNTDRNYQLSYYNDPADEAPLSAAERPPSLSDENKSASPAPETGSSGHTEETASAAPGEDIAARQRDDCYRLIEEQLSLNMDYVRATVRWQKFLEQKDLDISALAGVLALEFSSVARRLAKFPEK